MRLPRLLRLLGLVAAGSLMLANKCGGGGSGGGGLRGDKIVAPEEAGASGGRGAAGKAQGNDNAVGMATVIPTETARGPGYGRTDGTQKTHGP